MKFPSIFAALLRCQRFYSHCQTHPNYCRVWHAVRIRRPVFATWRRAFTNRLRVHEGLPYPQSSGASWGILARFSDIPHKHWGFVTVENESFIPTAFSTLTGTRMDRGWKVCFSTVDTVADNVAGMGFYGLV